MRAKSFIRTRSDSDIEEEDGHLMRISGKRCLRIIIMTVYHHRPERGHVCLSIEAGTIHCSWENRPLSRCSIIDVYVEVSVSLLFT